MTQSLDLINSTTYKGVQVSKISKSETAEVLHISIEKDAVFKKHISPKDALLVMLEGNISFFINDTSCQLTKHETLTFKKDVEHWVEAHQNSNFLIIR